MVVFFLLLGFNLTANSAPLSVLSSRSLLSPEGLSDGARVEMTLRVDEKGGNRIVGRVIDRLGEALIGVAIKVKGTAAGTVTNMDGEFSLEFSMATSVTLEFSCLGYKTQVDIVIILEEDSEGLKRYILNSPYRL